MVKKQVRSVISFLLVICLVISAVPAFSPRAQAEPGLVGKTLPVFAMNQIYARGMMVAGLALTKVAEASDSEGFQKATSIINKFVFGNNTTAQDLAEIKKMCADIISELNEIETQLNGIEQSLAEGEISDAYDRIGAAWSNDVSTPIHNISDGAFANMLTAYKNYVKCAYSQKTSEVIKVTNQNGVLVDVIANEALLNYWDNEVYSYLEVLTGESFTYDPENPHINEETFYAEKIYLTEKLDNIFINALNTLTANLTRESTSLVSNDRYIDRAAQFAYINYPYSYQQKDFVSLAAKNQSLEISLVVMLYQDFMGRRADYFKELYDAKAATTTDEAALQTYADGLDSYYATRENKLNTLICGEENVAGVVGKINNWLDGKIYIQNTVDSSYLYFDSYMGKESVGNTVLNNTSYYDDLSFEFYVKESEADRLSGEIADIDWDYGWDFINDKIKPAIKQAKKTNPSYLGSAVRFNKNAVITAKAGAQASVVPIAFLDAETVGVDNMYLKKFDMKWDINNNGDYHVPTDDYYNLARGVYSDGVNTYSIIDNPTELKSLLNETMYQAKGSVTANVFGEYTGYSGSNPMYLLTGEDTTGDTHGGIFVQTVYSGFKGVNIRAQKTYTDNWTSDTICQYYLQSDREGDENRSNTMYAVMLTADEGTVYSGLNFVFDRDGGSATVTGTTDTGENVYDSSTGKAIAGSTADITINPGRYADIVKVTLQYHNDASNPDKVTSQKVIYDAEATGTQYNLDENGSLSFGYPVTYTNATFVVETQQKEFETDAEGNFVIRTYDDLMKMASRVNEGEEKYVKGSYIVANDIQCEVSAWKPIGTNEDGFLGKFDGQGYKIIGLNTLPLTSSRDGLFSVVGEGAVVENIVLSQANLRTSQYEAIYDIGGIAQENMGTIRRCIVIDSVIVSQSASRAGGIVAKNTAEGTVEACAVINTELKRYLINTGTAGIADANSGTVNSCYVYNCTFSNPANNGDYNGVLIRSGNEPINSCYYTTSSVNTSYGTALTQEEFAAGKATYLLNGEKSDDSVFWFQNIDNGLTPDEYPVLVDNGQNMVFKVDLADKTYSNYFSQNGTLDVDENGRFVIYTYEDLLTMSAGINTGLDEYTTGTYTLMNDIVCGKGDWVPAGTKENAFAGTFLGNSYTLDGLSISDTSLEKVGLFAYIDEAGVVDGLTLTNVDFVIGIQATAGSIAAYNEGVITNCMSYGEISSAPWVEGAGYSVNTLGGIVGVNYGEISGCENNCTVTANKTSIISMAYLGGICAMNYGCIELSFNNADLETDAIMVGVGGIAGKDGALGADYSINNSYNIGNMTVNSVDPDFVDLDFVNRYLDKNGSGIYVDDIDELNTLLAQEANVNMGGLVGEANSSVVKNSYNVGSLMSYYRGNIGGLYGSSTGTFTNTYYLISDATEQTDSSMKYRAQFDSGEVAYLLQEGNTDSVWGQKSNTSGSLPCLTSLALYKVAELEAGGYSVASLGDVNNDSVVDVSDYQELVNSVVSREFSSSDVENHLDFIRADLNNDGYIDALDAADMDILMNGKNTVSVYAPGDFDGDGTATAEDAQNIRKAYEEALYINKSQQFACDLNGDGFFNDADLEKL